MLQKQVLLDKVEVFPDGELHVHRTMLITDDGEELMRKQDIEKIKRGGTLPKDGGIVTIIASALWAASAVQDGLRDPNYKKGKLYYIKGRDITKRPAGATVVPIGVTPNVELHDPKATTIKHKGKEHGARPVNYGQGSLGRSEPLPFKSIKHKGGDQR